MFQNTFVDVEACSAEILNVTEIGQKLKLTANFEQNISINYVTTLHDEINSTC